MAIGATLSVGNSVSLAFDTNSSNSRKVSSEIKYKAPPINNKASFLDPHQYAMVAVLADLIIPADEFQGASLAGVVDFIDKHLGQTTAYEQAAYRDGLKWLDKVSRRLHGNGFLDLDHSDQTNLLHRIYKMVGVVRMKGRGLGQRLKRKLVRTWYEFFDIMDNNVVFFIYLRRHVIYAFYANPESWVDIGYFGPPQPVGYLNYATPPTPDSYTGSVRPVENRSCLNCHPKGNHPRGGLINNTCQVCHRPHSPWHYKQDDFHVEDHIELAFPNLDRRKSD